MQSSGSRSVVQLNTEIKETEAQSKFFNERVSQIETYFGDLCTEFISYAKRTAKLRNNGDELSKILLNYSVNEKINRTTARTLKQFAELLSLLEDYRHAEVDRLLAKVITPLSTYSDEVKHIKTNIKVETAARKKEVSQLKRLSRDPHKGSDDRINNAAREAIRSAEALENHVVQFEAKKLKGLKEILTDFVHIEMLWHAKALETLTNAFNVVQSLQEDVDLADFRNTLFRSGLSSSLNVNIRQNCADSDGDTYDQYDDDDDDAISDKGMKKIKDEYKDNFDQESNKEDEESDLSMEEDSEDAAKQTDTRRRPEKPKTTSTPLKPALKQSRRCLTR
nr:hypothetical transcript [Hymenolepis microstoma]